MEHIMAGSGGRSASSPPRDLPSDLRALTDGHTWRRNGAGQSGGSIWQLTGDGQEPLYFKYGRDRIADAISDEWNRLEWLHGRDLAPAIHHYTRTSDEAWLLTSALPGRTAGEMLQAEPEQRIELAAELGRFLRRLHALPVSECPFDARATLRMAQARLNIAEGLVDSEDFDEERLGSSPEEVWDELMVLLPLPFEEVVTHGDFSVANVLVEGGRVTGLIDVGRLGVADPYQDLAIMWGNLGEYGAAPQASFLAAYQVGRLDDRRLRFHLILDEFF